LKCDSDESFPDGKYVRCRVLKSVPKQSLVEVSLRSSRLEGDLDDDETPPEGETIQAYVVETNKKGCFVRLARHIEGRATLTELCDGFLPDPKASFPPGRLVVGKIKSIGPTKGKSKNSKSPARFQADVDMRESLLLDSQKALSFEDIEVTSKYKGTVTRVESYGVFVQIENSKVSGLVHLSECSDNFVKNLGALYDPGDPVKVLVIKKDDAEKRIGFSMKASHFEDDEDSDDDSSVEDEADEDMLVDDALDSDDENFASNLAAKMERDKTDHEPASDDDKSDESVDSAESASSSDSVEEEEKTPALDTNVGFDWGFKGAASESKKAKKGGDSSDEGESSDSEEDDDDDAEKGVSHKSRKKQAQRRREEKEISKRETALADGTADENPETPADFERLLAGNPNSSELWIRYMAFYLSLADIPAARLVADKALARIEFREEQEKLNVWTALLTLEQKYGSGDSLGKAIERACGQNNPKQVYLRVCEILEKDLSSPDGVSRADAMYSKMCSKFKPKKKVWLAHLSYLLKQSRHEEAHALLKRALMSLAPYKHAETMSKFAQLEFEFGSPERARTLFEGITTKYPNRLDLFFVYVDKEVKFGSFQTARSLLESKVDQGKLTDKQVKGLFKKWYRLEEQNGTEESVEHVKESARKYVQKSSE
jgi:rRNA biogenesis protein RRP5